MTPDDIDDVVARLKAQRFWPHLPDLDEDCADAVTVIEQLKWQLAAERECSQELGATLHRVWNQPLGGVA